MKKIPHRFYRPMLKSWRYILSFLGLFLGFSNAVVAQYGIVENYFKITGSVVADDCPPLPEHLKVTLQQKEDDQSAPYNIAEAYTNEAGRFSMTTYDMSYQGQLSYLVQDVDGPDNGTFHDTVYVIGPNQLSFTNENEGHWTRMYINKEPIILKVRREGPSPCDPRPEPVPILIPLLPEPLASDTSEPFIQEIADSLMLIGEGEPLWSNDTGGPLGERILITAYPNPNSGVLYVRIVVNEPSDALLRFFDDRYRKILEEAIDLKPGSNLHLLELSSLAPGTYFLEIQTGTSREVIKIIRSGNTN